MPETVRVEAVAVARAIEDAQWRATALVWLAPHIPETLLAEAVVAARAIEDAQWQATALAGLTPHLPELDREQVLREALAKAQAIQDVDNRVGVLAGLALRLAELSPASLYPLWCATLPLLARRTRQDLLADIFLLAPIIAALGGEEAVVETFRAVQDVGRWWP